jgi:hypothetical protein
MAGADDTSRGWARQTLSRWIARIRHRRDQARRRRDQAHRRKWAEAVLSEAELAQVERVKARIKAGTVSLEEDIGALWAYFFFFGGPGGTEILTLILKHEFEARARRDVARKLAIRRGASAGGKARAHALSAEHVKWQGYAAAIWAENPKLKKIEVANRIKKRHNVDPKPRNIARYIDRP